MLGQFLKFLVKRVTNTAPFSRVNTNSKQVSQTSTSHSLSAFLIALALTLFAPITANAAFSKSVDLTENMPRITAQIHKPTQTNKPVAVRVAMNGFFDPFQVLSTSHHIKKYKKKKATPPKPKYHLGAKLPKNGYIKSYKYNSFKKNLNLDDDGLGKYRAQKYNGRYQRRSGGQYRTMCVRLKDGYYWPINFAQSRHKFKKDNIKCQRSCSDKVRLFYYSGTTDDIKNMRDLKGRRYANLKTAFLYRTKYVKSANCRAKPWSKEAKAKHVKYALKDAGKKRRMHRAAIKRAEKKRVAYLTRSTRKYRKSRRRYSKKRARYRRSANRVYRRKRYKKS